MRVRVLTAYVAVAAVNASAGWLHLAGGDSALGWAFILATLAFLLLGWEADGRMLAARWRARHGDLEPLGDAADLGDPGVPGDAAVEPGAGLALAGAPRGLAGADAARLRFVAWLAVGALIVGLELRLMVGLDAALSGGIGLMVFAGGLALRRLVAPSRTAGDSA